VQIAIYLDLFFFLLFNLNLFFYLLKFHLHLLSFIFYIQLVKKEENGNEGKDEIVLNKKRKEKKKKLR
jgi:hypothetical protein